MRRQPPSLPPESASTATRWRTTSPITRSSGLEEIVMAIADAGGASAPDRGPGYRLAASGRERAEDDRLELLEQLFDPGSREWRHRVQPGWRCLEVGAGRGSMAAWLADRVGPTGRVVATDVDLTYLSRLEAANLEVRRHDILEDPL